MKEAIAAAIEALAAGQAAALISPVATEGSLPTPRMARMLVNTRGDSVGTVGGGRMEGETITAGVQVARSTESRLCEFSLSAQAAAEDGLLCGGRVTFLIEALQPGSEDALVEILRLLEEGQPGLEALRLDHAGVGQRLVVREDGIRMGSLGDGDLDTAAAALVGEALDDDLSETRLLELAGAAAEVHLNALRPHPTVYIFGGGHVGLALARIAPTAGFRVAILDDRDEFANRERFPMAHEVLMRPFDQSFDGLKMDSLSYVVVMTRGHKWDREVVAQALRTEAGYIGMIGSRRKIAHTWEALKATGFTDADLDRVHAPIGLDIGGDSPGEIAISIMAQLIATHRLGDGAGECPVE